VRLVIPHQFSAIPVASLAFAHFGFPAAVVYMTAVLSIPFDPDSVQICLEVASTYTNLQEQSTEVLQCPRCSSTITDRWVCGTGS
jgi:hypothetical protein